MTASSRAEGLRPGSRAGSGGRGQRTGEHKPAVRKAALRRHRTASRGARRPRVRWPRPAQRTCFGTDAATETNHRDSETDRSETQATSPCFGTEERHAGTAGRPRKRRSHAARRQDFGSGGEPRGTVEAERPAGGPRQVRPACFGTRAGQPGSARHPQGAAETDGKADGLRLGGGTARSRRGREVGESSRPARTTRFGVTDGQVV